MPRSPRSMPPGGFAPRARGRSFRRCAGCCSPPAAGAWTRSASPCFSKGSSGKRRSPGASWGCSARRCARRCSPASRSSTAVRLRTAARLLYISLRCGTSPRSIWMRCWRRPTPWSTSSGATRQGCTRAWTSAAAGTIARASKRSRAGKIRARCASRRRRCVSLGAPRVSGGVTSGTGSTKIPSAQVCRGKRARRTFWQTFSLRSPSPPRLRSGRKAPLPRRSRSCRSRRS